MENGMTEKNEAVGLRRMARAAVCISVLASGVIHAGVPAVKFIGTATPVPAATWWTQFPSGTTHTPGVAVPTSTPAELAELTRALSVGGACTQACYASA